eukprot:14387520-Heterocapsa_arctica.AAC.1
MPSISCGEGRDHPCWTGVAERGGTTCGSGAVRSIGRSGRVMKRSQQRYCKLEDKRCRPAIMP